MGYSVWDWLQGFGMELLKVRSCDVLKWRRHAEGLGSKILELQFQHTSLRCLLEYQEAWMMRKQSVMWVWSSSERFRLKWTLGNQLMGRIGSHEPEWDQSRGFKVVTWGWGISVLTGQVRRKWDWGGAAERWEENQAIVGSQTGSKTELTPEESDQLYQGPLTGHGMENREFIIQLETERSLVS